MKIEVKIEGEENIREFLSDGGPRRIAELVGISLDEPATVDPAKAAAMKTSWAGDTSSPSAPPPGDVKEAGPSLKVPGGQDYNYYYKYPTDPFSNPFQGQLTHNLMDGIVPPDKPQDVTIGHNKYNVLTFHVLVRTLTLGERIEIVTAKWDFGQRIHANGMLYCPLGLCDIPVEFYDNDKSNKALPTASIFTSALLLSKRIRPTQLESIYGNVVWFMDNWDTSRIKQSELPNLFEIEYREEGRWHDTTAH